MEVRAPADTPALRIAGLGEDEVLLGRGLTFRVVDDLRVPSGGGHVVVEVGPSSSARQREMDTTRAVVELAIDVEENAAKGASARAIVSRVRSRLKRLRIEPSPEGYVWRRPGGDVELTPDLVSDDPEVSAARDLATFAAEVESLASGGASADELIDTARRRAGGRNLTPVGRAGDVIPYDSSAHQTIGPVAPGHQVLVIRPGYTWRTEDGDIVVERPTVMDAGH
jgi:hypothetical protein